MSALFSIMEAHLDAPRVPNPAGKIVLSRLRPGTSVIGAPAASVKLVLEGEENYRVEGRSYRVRAGQFLYLEAGTDCLGTNRGDTTGLCLLLPGAGDPLAAGRDEPVIGRALALSTRTSPLGRTLEKFGRAIARDPALGPSLAPRLIASVARAVEEPLAESRAVMARLEAVKPSTRRELFQRLEIARAFLHEHRDRAITLGELASIAGLSSFHLARYFKSAFGAPPIAYHRNLRLALAAEFLARGEGNVAEAAAAAGYSDQTALSHAFRRHYGRSPLQWAMGG